MNIIRFFKLLSRRVHLLFLIPVIAGLIAFLLVKDMPSMYSTEATIFSGITSNSGLDVQQESRVDNFAIQNEFNNVLSILKSRSILEEVSLKLLTQHLMLDEPKDEIISEDAYKDLQRDCPSEVKKLIVRGNFLRSYENLKKYTRQDESNYVYQLLNRDNSYYGYNTLSGIKSERINSSDIIRIYYEADDPGISYNTVRFISEIFIVHYSRIKNNQSSSAVAYFEAKLKEAAEKLRISEDRMLEFNTQNDIINYYEQTEQVTTQQEKIELQLQSVKMEYLAAQAVLTKLESEVKIRYKINLKTNDIMKLRDELLNYNHLIAQGDFYLEPSVKEDRAFLISRRNQLEEKLSQKIDSINHYDSNSQGIEVGKLLERWIDAVKNHETYKAQYESIKERHEEFLEQFKRYAPLGATLKKNEREIDVYEREYLSILHHLGLATQKLQNTDIIANMKIMDEPKLPIKSLPSKKSLFVIIAAFFSLIMYVGGLFVLELLDKRIKTPIRLKNLTGIPVVSAFCRESDIRLEDEQALTTLSVNYLAEKVEVVKNKSGSLIVQMVTVNNDSGYLRIAGLIRDDLEARAMKVTLIDLSEDPNQPLNPASGDAVSLIVVPPLITGIRNPSGLAMANLNVIVYSANSTWSESDEFHLEKLKEYLKGEVFTLLTEADADDLEEMFGTIPKKRSALRSSVKKMLQRFTSYK